MDQNENPRDIRQTLLDLHQELESTPELDDDLRTLLMEVDSDIHALLAAEDHAHPGSEGLRDRLEALSADFAARHPNTETFFREVIHALGRMGI
jgi:hypothetical protein